MKGIDNVEDVRLAETHLALLGIIIVKVCSENAKQKEISNFIENKAIFTTQDHVD